MIKKFFNKWFLFTCLLCVVLLVASLGTYGTTQMPSNYYQTAEWESNMYDSTVFKLTLNKDDDGNVAYAKSVWIKLGGYDYSTTSKTVSMRLTTATSQTGTYSSGYGGGDKSITGINQTLNSFYKAWDITSTSTSRVYYQLATKSVFKIDEIVVLDENGDKVGLEILYSGPTAKTDEITSTIKSSEYAYRVEHAKRLIDEQSLFNTDYVNGNKYFTTERQSFTELERITLESVRNILSGYGQYVDGTVNAFGLELIAVGVAIFGGNTFGIRFMPLVFTLLTVFVAYAIGKLLLGKESYGFLTALLYAAGGFALSGATLGTVNPIFTFFVVTSFYFMFKFYKKGVNYNNKIKSLTPLALSGIFFAFALSTKMQALYSLLGLVVLFVLTILRTVKVSKSKTANLIGDELYDAEYILRRKITLSLVTFLAFTVLFAILWLALTFVFALGAYAGAHQGATLGEFIVYIFGAFGRVNATTYSNYNQSNILAYLINFKAEKASAVKFVSGNVVLSAMALFSLIYLTSYVLSMYVSKAPEVKTKEFKKQVLTPYILLGVAFIANLVLSLFNANGALGEFMHTSVFYYAMISLCFSVIKNDENKALFTVKGNAIKISDIVLYALIAFAIVALGFSYVRLIGIPVDKYLFNILAIKW